MEASITMVAIYKVTSCARLWQLQVKEDRFQGNITRHRFRLFLARAQEEKDDACNIPGTLEELEEKAGVRLVNVSPCHCVFHAAGDLANFVRLLSKWFRYQTGWGEIHIHAHGRRSRALQGPRRSVDRTPTRRGFARELLRDAACLRYYRVRVLQQRGRHPKEAR